MNLRCLLSVILIGILCITLPVTAHVSVNAEGNYDISTAFSVEKPIKSCVIYGNLPKAGDVAYYQLMMNPGERLVLSLLTPGYNASIPEMVVMSPGTASTYEGLTKPVNIPQGYGAEFIMGETPQSAEYEPFGPSAVFEVASYTKEITVPGRYYLAVISPADETPYSIAVGYVDEFSLSEWVLVPVNTISAHIWVGQSILVILTPFLAVTIFGFIIIRRREKRRGLHFTCSCWLATIAGLCYLGGAAVTLVQMVRAIAVTGTSPSVALTLAFAIIPIALGIWALRIGRTSSGRTMRDRAWLVLIAVFGLVFWAGLIIGPVLAIGAAALPEHLPHHNPASK